MAGIVIMTEAPPTQSDLRKTIMAENWRSRSGASFGVFRSKRLVADLSGHVWTAPAGQGDLWRFGEAGLVQSCLRPLVRRP